MHKEKKFKVNGGFECDKQSKYDFTASTINYLQEKYYDKDMTVVFKELDKYGNIVEFNSPYANPQSRTDLIMFFNGVAYSIELKERWGRYTSNYYGEEGCKEGWMLNIDKEEELKKNKNYIPLYVNLYPDNVVRTWNLNNIKHYSTITKDICKTTVVESEKKTQNRYELWNKDGKSFKRIIGKPSNGIWYS